MLNLKTQVSAVSFHAASTAYSFGATPNHYSATEESPNGAVHYTFSSELRISRRIDTIAFGLVTNASSGFLLSVESNRLSDFIEIGIVR